MILGCLHWDFKLVSQLIGHRDQTIHYSMVCALKLNQ